MVLVFCSMYKSDGNKIYISYASADAHFVKELAKNLRSKGLVVFLDLLDVVPGEDFYEQNVRELGNAQVVFVMLSPASVVDKTVLDQISFARSQGKKIIPVFIGKCEVPYPINTFQSVDLTKNYLAGLELLTQSVVKIASPPDVLSAPHSPAPTILYNKKQKNIVTRVLEKLNPFKTKKSNSFDDFERSVGSPAGGGNPALNSMDKMMQEAEHAPVRKPVSASGEPKSAKAKPPYDNPDKRMKSAAPPPPPQQTAAASPPGETNPARGKVLYDIPDNMVVNRQHKCVVRIGENEAIVLDDDTFSDAMKIESISISGVMKVDLVDISDPARFNIKTVNSSEQEVEGGSYTEWLFWVTPLTNGMFPLILKISILKMVDGKERRKELVFEKSVTISAEPEQSLIQPLVAKTPTTQPYQAEPDFKDLLNDKNVIDTDPPSAFISYAHKDKIYFDIFKDYFETQSGWKIWTDRNIEIGSDWYGRIEQSINDTDIAVLLISAYFISSAFIKENEVKKFSILKSNKPDFIFLPILLRDVDFTRWEELAAMQLFVAYGDEYGVPEKRGQMIPFAKLCRFDNDGQLIPNDNLDTYFKNLVKKAEKDWLKKKVVAGG